MKLLRYTLAALVLSSSVALAGCGGDPEPAPAVEEVTQDDVVDLGDLIAKDMDPAAAAEMVGDPATMLAEARSQGEKARTDVARVLGFVRELGTGAPTNKGVRADGTPFAQWVKEIQGKTTHLVVGRMAPDRFRYLVAVEGADAKPVPLLTGIFVKKGPRSGGGRLHVDLTAISDAYGIQPADGAADGSIHFWFANHKGDARGRRIAYRNVVRRDDPDKRVINYGADLVRLVGVGGRFRSVGIGDLVPEAISPGPEALGLRVLWKRGEGGRGVAVIASLASKMVLGTAHECWDKDGLRTAYESDPVSAMNPNEGDLTMCAGFAREMPPPADRVNENGSDADPELDALLDESGAKDIDEMEASRIEAAP